MTNSAKTEHAKPKTDSPHRTTKKALLIKLLGPKSGADLKSLSDKLGWQPHTTRAAMSGLRKAGYVVATQKGASGGPAKYRILSAPSPQQSTRAGAIQHGA